MSHRQPPEDRVPGLKFMAWMVVLCLVIGGIWWIVWEVMS